MPQAFVRTNFSTVVGTRPDFASRTKTEKGKVRLGWVGQGSGTVRMVPCYPSPVLLRHHFAHPAEGSRPSTAREGWWGWRDPSHSHIPPPPHPICFSYPGRLDGSKTQVGPVDPVCGRAAAVPVVRWHKRHEEVIINAQKTDAGMGESHSC
jgi:hypothetical protein